MFRLSRNIEISTENIATNIATIHEFSYSAQRYMHSISHITALRTLKPLSMKWRENTYPKFYSYSNIWSYVSNDQTHLNRGWNQSEIIIMYDFVILYSSLRTWIAATFSIQISSWIFNTRMHSERPSTKWPKRKQSVCERRIRRKERMAGNSPQFEGRGSGVENVDRN